MSDHALPPVERSVSVSWDVETAFRRFAIDFGNWWPAHSHSVGGARVRRVVLEPRAGGCIFEEHHDGRRFQWGRIVTWDPPRRLAFTFHPSRAAETAQRVEVRFVPNEGGTRVELVSTGWEAWQGQRQARAARRAYSMGWAYLLDYWADRRTAGRFFGAALIGVAKAVNALRGGDAATIARSRGEIATAHNETPSR
jgi:hypothetical protein